MLELADLADILNKDPIVQALPKFGRCAIRFGLGDRAFIVRVGTEIEVQTELGINDTWDVEFTVPREAWDRYDAPVPPPGYNTAQALVAHLGPDVVRGDRRKWAQYAPLVQRVVQLLGTPEPRTEAPHLPRVSNSVGRYMTVGIRGTDHRIFYETAGDGIPLLCLHTAGSDSRQYRYVLEDEEITSSFKVIAFDMPWHGRSSPPPDWRSQRYELTVENYAATILAVCDALDLSSPVLMGCSMGGSIALYMASAHGDRFRGVIALEGGFGNPSRRVTWTRHIEVDHSLFLTTWVDGLMSPNSPQELRDEILWEYSQSAPGVYNGDTYLVAELPDVGSRLTPATCPLYVFCGDYDYSSTPDMSRSAAEALGGEFVLMEGMGHFPMAEDPLGFKRHLMPVLQQLDTERGSDGRAG